MNKLKHQTKYIILVLSIISLITLINASTTISNNPSSYLTSDNLTLNNSGFFGLNGYKLFTKSYDVVVCKDDGTKTQNLNKICDFMCNNLNCTSAVNDGFNYLRANNFRSILFKGCGLWLISGSTGIYANNLSNVLISGEGMNCTQFVLVSGGDLMSISGDKNVIIQDLSLDTYTYDHNSAIAGSNVNYTTLTRVKTIGGDNIFGVYFAGPTGASQGNPIFDYGNKIYDSDFYSNYSGDGFSWSLQKDFIIQNSKFSGSRIALFYGNNGNLNHNYIANAISNEGIWITSDSPNLTFDNLHIEYNTFAPDVNIPLKSGSYTNNLYFEHNIINSYENSTGPYNAISLSGFTNNSHFNYNTVYGTEETCFGLGNIANSEISYNTLINCNNHPYSNGAGISANSNNSVYFNNIISNYNLSSFTYYGIVLNDFNNTVRNNVINNMLVSKYLLYNKNDTFIDDYLYTNLPNCLVGSPFDNKEIHNSTSRCMCISGSWNCLNINDNSYSLNSFSNISVQNINKTGILSPNNNPISSYGLFFYTNFKNNITDFSGNGNSANQVILTYNNDRFGQVGVFNGVTSKIAIPLVIPNSTNFSMSVWIKPISTSQAFTIIRDNSGSGAGMILRLQVTTGFPLFYCGGTALITGNYQVAPLNVWTHLVYMLNSTGSYIYVNGEKKFNGTIGYCNSTTNFLIGQGAGGEWANGSIANLMLWNRSLYTDEIKSIYENNNELSFDNANQLKGTDYNPITNIFYNLGSSVLRWLKLWVKDIDSIGTAQLNNTIINGTLTMNGSIGFTGTGATSCVVTKITNGVIINATCT